MRFAFSELVFLFASAMAACSAAISAYEMKQSSVLLNPISGTFKTAGSGACWQTTVFRAESAAATDLRQALLRPISHLDLRPLAADRLEALKKQLLRLAPALTRLPPREHSRIPKGILIRRKNALREPRSSNVRMICQDRLRTSTRKSEPKAALLLFLVSSHVRLLVQLVHVVSIVAAWGFKVRLPQNASLFWSFLWLCPEPVLVK
jgi:hypothetical protein